MDVTITIHGRDEEHVSYAVANLREARRQVNSFMAAKACETAHFIVDGGIGTCLNIPVAEVTGIEIKF